MLRSLALVCCLAASARAQAPAAPARAAEDLRNAYDVRTYRLDVAVDPEAQSLAGTLAADVLVTADALAVLRLDLRDGFTVTNARELAKEIDPRAALTGAPLEVARGRNSVELTLTTPRKRGERVRIALDYAGRVGAKDAFEGVHWKKTEAGKPWISIACQGVGASWWWPCKDSYWHPEDKPERTLVNATVPKGLYAVSNGRLSGRTPGDERETFHWVHDYPCETYAITLDVAPYVVVAQKVTPGELAEPLDFVYYVLPENAAKAKLQFTDVPRMLEVFTQAFGPYPFPKSKYALVETSFWGMEHSTAVAYGSSYPKWCEAERAPDPYAEMNRGFDYILVHESAHEWWGNAVSAKSWGHFWLHEGFATYAEAVYLEFTQGRAAADEHFAHLAQRVGTRARVFRGDAVDSGKAYSDVIYSKGAWVLNTLRHCVNDDDAWWRTLRAFNLEFRYSNADTEDFRAVLERETKKSWRNFFDEWVYGTGHPHLEGTVSVEPPGIVIDIANTATDKTVFNLPIDIVWKAGVESGKRRIWLSPGANHAEIELKARPRDVVVIGPERILGEHHVTVE